MKEKLKKILGFRLENKWIAFLAVPAMLVLLLPLFRILPYTAPWYDDYNFGKFVKLFLEQDYSIGSALRGAWYCIRTQWYAWQGTFSSIFFMCMMPAAFGDAYYFLGPLFLLVILFFSTMVLTKVLLRNVLGADWFSVAAVQAITVSIIFEFLYSLNGGIYWYNGGVHYVGMHSFFLLLAAGWICLLLDTTKPLAAYLILLWTILGAILAGGANFVTALQGLLLGLSLVALGILLKKKKTFMLLPSLLVYVPAMYLNVTAPGNAVRAGILGDIGYPPLQAVLRSFLEAFRYLWIFTGLKTILVLLVLVPIVWKMTKDLKFEFRFPGLLTVWSFCFYATGFTPSLYSLGHAGLGRTLNAVQITFYMLLVVNLVYWIGWLQRRVQWKKRGLDHGAHWWFYPLAGLLMLAVFAVEPNQSAEYSTFATYYYVHTGEAFNFQREYQLRIEAIQNGGDDVVVEPYVFKPWVLQSGELTSNSMEEPNRAIAEWYHKKSVTCVKSQE